MVENEDAQVVENQDSSGFIKKLIMIKLVVLAVVAVATVILIQTI